MSIITTLADLTIDGRGHYGIGASAVQFSDDLYTYLRITDINDDGTVNLNDLMSVDNEKAKDYLLQPNDIVFARTGASAGRNYFYDGKDGQFVYAGFLIKFSIDPSKVNPKYVKYYCQSDQYKGWVASFSTGSTRGNINAKTFAQMPIPLISRDKQDLMVNILSFLEDKIRVNCELNQNLEQQTRELYNDFIRNNSVSPVKVDEIVLSANTGADAIKKAPIVNENTGIRCVRVGDMSNNRPYHEWGFTKVDPEVFDQYQLHKDDIIVTRTASLGLNMLISNDMKAVYNNGLIRLTINKQRALPLIVYMQLQTNDFFNYIKRISGETSVRPNMKINYLLQYEFLLPTLDNQKQLCHLLQPLYDAQQRNIIENKELTEIRDVLLPKLMSGELDVSAIDI